MVTEDSPKTGLDTSSAIEAEAYKKFAIAPDAQVTQGKTIIIGLSGKAGAGKDTAYEAIEDSCPWDMLIGRISFAEPIKTMLAECFNLPLAYFENRALKEQKLESVGKSPRELMLSLGHDWGRLLVKDSIWVDIAMQKVASAKAAGYKVIVITDVRYESEASAIRKAGGTIWHIYRPDSLVINHVSENGVSVQDGDLQFVNNSSIEAFMLSISQAFKSVAQGGLH